MTPLSANCAYVLTPPGTGAIGVVRVVGPDAESIGRSVFRPAGRWVEASLQYGTFIDGDTIVDDVIVSRSLHANPPAIDICAHGGVRVIERILLVLQGLGASLETKPNHAYCPWPTRDAIEREAIQALVKAKTERAVVFLAYQRNELPKAVRRMADLCERNPNEAFHEIEKITNSFSVVRTLLDGATVAIVGATNAGKSTLFNRLVGRQAAVVSEQAGTTRDWVSADIEFDGFPISLIDTAGRRNDADPLEADALAAVQEKIAHATVRLVLVDGTAGLSTDVAQTIRGYQSLGPCIVAATKSDLALAWNLDEFTSSIGVQRGAVVRVSAQDPDGIEDFSQILSSILSTETNFSQAPAAFTIRQMDFFNEALENVRNHGDLAKKSLLQLLSSD